MEGSRPHCTMCLNFSSAMQGFLRPARPWKPNWTCSGRQAVQKSIGMFASGARSDRPQLQSLLKALEPGAVVVVTRLDRLARSTIDLLTTIKQIADKGCLFKSLADPWADTTTPGGRLMLTVLGGLAEFERELIKARTSEGRDRAKRAGVKMGRKPILSAHQIAEIRSRKANGESVRFLARSYRVSPNTISRVR